MSIEEESDTNEIVEDEEEEEEENSQNNNKKDPIKSKFSSNKNKELDLQDPNSNTNNLTTTTNNNTYQNKEKKSVNQIEEEESQSLSKNSIKISNENNKTESNKNENDSQSNISKENLNEKKFNEKTVFTKLTEEMYKNLMDDKKAKQYTNYDTLTCDNFLGNFSKKFNENNNQTIDDFLKRNETEVNKYRQKINKINNDKKEQKLYIEKKYNHINKKPPSKRFTNFLEKQKHFENNKQNNIENLKYKINSERNKNLTNKPMVNSKSNKMILINSKNQNIQNSLNKNVFNKLFDESNTRNQKQIINIKKNNFTEKKLNKQSIANLSKRLYNESKIRNESLKNAQKLRNSKIKNKQNEKKLSSNTNEIIIKKFYNTLNSSLKNNFEKDIKNNIELSFKDFLLILFSNNFVIKNYSHFESSDTKYTEKEFQLSLDAFKVILRKKEVNPEEDKIFLHNIILFLLSIIDVYDGGKKNNLINKVFPFINLDEENIDEKLVKQIKIFFRLFKENYFNLINKKDYNPSKNIIEDLKKKEENLTFKPKINRSSSTNKNINIKKNNDNRLSVEKNYNIFGKKYEQNLEKERNKKMEEEMKECTFFPNNKKLKKNRSFSENVGNRLYNYAKNSKRFQSNSQKSSQFLQNNFSYMPTLTKYNSKIFENNPLKEDNSVQNMVKNYSQSRINKQISNYAKNKGFNNIKDNQSLLNEINSNLPIKNFRFDNERTNNYKNTFERFDKSKKKNVSKKNIRYIFEINIENKTKQLVIHKGDNINKQVDKFCIENDLENESKAQIMEAIKNKFKE